MKQQRLYTPKCDLKEIVTELIVMMAGTNPGYEPLCKEMLEEMDKWGKPVPTQQHMATEPERKV